MGILDWLFGKQTQKKNEKKDSKTTKDVKYKTPVKSTKKVKVEKEILSSTFFYLFIIYIYGF